MADAAGVVRLPRRSERPARGQLRGDYSQASPPGLRRPGLKPFPNLWKALVGQQPGNLRGCPAVAPCRGPNAAQFQLSGNGCQRRLTRPLDLGNNRSRRWQLGGSLIYSGFLAFNFLGSFPQRRSYDIVVEGLLCRSKNAGPDRSRFFSGGECERSARSPAAFRAVKMWALPLEQHSRHFAPVIDPLGEGYWERI